MNSKKLLAHMGRREDFRFVTGQGRYTADMVPHDALHAAFVRSPIMVWPGLIVRAHY